MHFGGAAHDLAFSQILPWLALPPSCIRESRVSSFSSFASPFFGSGGGAMLRFQLVNSLFVVAAHVGCCKELTPIVLCCYLSLKINRKNREERKRFLGSMCITPRGGNSEWHSTTRLVVGRVFPPLTLLLACYFVLNTLQGAGNRKFHPRLSPRSENVIPPGEILHPDCL